LRPKFILYKIWEEMKCQTIDRWKKLGAERKQDIAEIVRYDVKPEEDHGGYTGCV
jgi:hypothetical protein